MAFIHLKSVLVIGGTGPLSFGRFVVEELIVQLGHFDRVTIFNDLSRPDSEEKRALLQRWSASGIDILDGYKLDSPEMFKGFDAVVLLLGQSGLHLQPQIIDLAIEAGVRHIYPSEYGADLEVGRNWTMRYYKYKTQTREHLKFRGDDVPELGWTIFMLGRLAEWALLPHFGVDNRNEEAHIYGSAGGRQSLIATQGAAAYVVATLRTPIESGKQRRSFRISGSSPTYGQIFDMIRGCYGQKIQGEVSGNRIGQRRGGGREGQGGRRGRVVCQPQAHSGSRGYTAPAALG